MKNSSIGKTLKKRREAAGIRIKDLSAQLNLDLQFLKGVESGQWDQAILKISKIAQALGTDIRSLIDEKDSLLPKMKSKRMEDLIQNAKQQGGKNIAVICPDETVMLAVNKGIQEGVIKDAYLVGKRDHLDPSLFLYSNNYQFISPVEKEGEYFSNCASMGVALVTQRKCHLLMKGKINTTVFVKAILNKESGIRTDTRLSLIGIFELPNIDRLIFLTDPGINPSLVADDNLKTAVDIIKNSIDVAKGLGVTCPKVALLEANEKPSDKIPMTIYEQRLSEMEWGEATVFGPLSYDLALYSDSVKKKGFENNPVAGKADILVVPYIAGGNFLYKAWVKTIKAEVATVVVGAKVPLILTSRADSERAKFLTLCASSVYSQYLANRYKENL